MLNNQNLKNKHIDYIPYQLQVKLFDAKCKGCDYAAYRVVKKTGIAYIYFNYREAMDYATDNRAPLQRFCTFNDDEFSLAEIIHNHCMFWDEIPVDVREDTEVTEISLTEVTQLKCHLFSLESFVKLKE